MPIFLRVQQDNDGKKHPQSAEKSKNYLNFLLPLGHEGRGGGHGHRSGGNGNSGGLVSDEYAHHQAGTGGYALCRSICGRMLMLGIDKCVDIIAGLF